MNDWFFWMLVCLAALPLGWLLWTLLGTIRLARSPRILLTVFGAGISALLLVWGGLSLAILMYTWNDPVTW